MGFPEAATTQGVLANTAVDLTNCDREPIHVPGQIQAHGALLALDPRELEVLQASDNTLAYLGVAATELLGKRLGSVLEAEDLAAVRWALLEEQLTDNPLYLFTGKVRARGPFHAVGHLRDGVLLLELEPVVGDVEHPDFYTVLKRSVLRFQRAQNLADFSQLVTDEVRRVSGFDRVMIYRFAPDWSGHVIAESVARDRGLESFLDLHYPASDIPAQARALFLLNSVRMLPDARYAQSRLVPELNPRTGKPLDLSYTFLRGASQMYTEYLINMGVTASLTMAITRADQLWGLVACHHYSRRELPYDVRAACDFLSRVVSLQVADKLLHDEAAYRRRIALGHEQLVTALGRTDDLAEALLGEASSVFALLDCGGGALFRGGVCHRFGSTPAEPELRGLLEWLFQTHGTEVFATDALSSLYPPAAKFADTAAGVLCIPVSGPGADCILWMRPEAQRSVKWAGDPNKPVETGPLGDRLTPRKSFALWQETVRGRSAPWLDLEIEAARKLRATMTDLLRRRSEELERLNLELARSNAELDAFAYVASHDLKEPLRGIYNLSRFLLEDTHGTLDAANNEKVETIIRLARRMQTLIDSLLFFSRLGRAPILVEAVDLNVAVREALETTDARLRESGARVDLPRPLPTVRADRVGLQEILVNLLSNALKYNDKADKRVEVGSLLRGEPGFPARAQQSACCIYVRDNGIGIPEASRDEVFRIFRRLHQQTEYGGGTGAGLTIVRKVVQRHGGEVWCESKENEGTTFYFTLGDQ